MIAKRLQVRPYVKTRKCHRIIDRLDGFWYEKNKRGVGEDPSQRRQTSNKGTSGTCLASSTAGKSRGSELISSPVNRCLNRRNSKGSPDVRFEGTFSHSSGKEPSLGSSSTVDPELVQKYRCSQSPFALRTGRICHS